LKTALNRISENFNLHSLSIAEQTKGMKVFRSDSLTYVDSGLSCATFNIAHITSPDTLTEEELRKTVEYFRSRNLQFCIWISEENLSEKVKTFLQSAGVTLQKTETGMELDLIKYQEKEDPFHLSAYLIRNYSELQHYAEVVAANWTPPDQNIIDYFQTVSDHILNKHNHILLAAYYENEKPVAVLEMFPSNAETVGIYGLATLKKFRGRGIGTSLLTFALNHAKRLGYHWAGLQASEKGLGLYKRMGFKVYTTYYEFA
jgi:GNAT superfamily N-acetyltransferase